MKTVEKIFQDHNLSFERIEKSTIGFINEVYLTDNYVVKIYGKNVNGYKRERWLYSQIMPEYAPKLIGLGDNYIIMERITGDGLYHIWPRMSDQEREKAIEKIADIMIGISKADYSDAGDIFEKHNNWKEFIEMRIFRTLTQLNSKNAIDSKMAQKVQNYVRDNAYTLTEEGTSLVYADFHFDNLLVHESGKIYLIDYETLCVAPKDYMLDVWNRMMIHPFIYANEKDHNQAKQEDYTHILEWLQKYLPDMFHIKNLNKRISLYGIDYDLRILLDYPNDELLLERLEKAISQ